MVRSEGGHEKVVGVVTEGDFLRTNDGGRPRIIEVVTGGTSAGELMIRHVEEIMTRDPITAGIKTPLEEVVVLMQQHH